MGKKSRRKIVPIVPKNSPEYQELMQIRKTLLEAQKMIEEAKEKLLEQNKKPNDQPNLIISVKDGD